ncbi:hypothetical protein IAT38_008357 [Cryptococcus sp. DSM 104549]
MLSLRPLLRTAPAPSAISRSVAASRSLHFSAPRANREVSPTTPVPTVEDGSEPTEYSLDRGFQAEAVSGAPAELLHRPVRIYRPTKNTMQSAKGKTKRWMLDFDVLQGAGRWENRLMGWASSADYMQGTSLAFKSKEEAIFFAEKQGWPYKVDEPKKVVVPPKNYANNYVHVPGKLRIHHTK